VRIVVKCFKDRMDDEIRYSFSFFLMPALLKSRVCKADAEV